MSTIGSVTKLIDLVKIGDDVAAQKLWDLFSGKLLCVARTHLPGHSLAGADEEDVVLSALGSFFTGAQTGKFTRLRHRESLWHLLCVITQRKAIDLIVHEGRQKRTPGARHHDETLGIRFGANRDPTEIERAVDPGFPPDLQALIAEECERLLDALDDPQLRAVAVWKMEGHTDLDIASFLGCTVRTVERKISLIRRIWQPEEIR